MALDFHIMSVKSLPVLLNYFVFRLTLTILSRILVDMGFYFNFMKTV